MENEINVGQMLMQQVVPQLIVAVGIALPLLIVWLRSKTAKMIRDNVKNEALQKALLWANGLVMDMVGAAQQTSVKKLKRDLADGTVTKEEYTKSMAEIKREMLTKLSDLTVGRLLSTGAAATTAKVVTMLSEKIEAAIPLAKGAQAIAKNGGASDLTVGRLLSTGAAATTDGGASDPPQS